MCSVGFARIDNKSDMSNLVTKMKVMRVLPLKVVKSMPNRFLEHMILTHIFINCFRLFIRNSLGNTQNIIKIELHIFRLNNSSYLKYKYILASLKHVCRDNHSQICQYVRNTPTCF